jgi:predicted nucleic acid-binding protein
MPDSFIDTSVLIRLLTGDDPTKQQAAVRLFERVENGGLVLRAPMTVVSEAAYVLTSGVLYGLPRSRAAELLIGLLALDGFRVESKQRVRRALEIFGATNVDFGDAMLAASMEAEGSTDIYSYDRDFERPGMNRLTP